MNHLEQNNTEGDGLEEDYNEFTKRNKLVLKSQ